MESKAKLKINVVMRLWRVEYALNGVFGDETIKYSIEAESWSKARIKAEEEMGQIISMLCIDPDQIRIKSITSTGLEVDHPCR